MTERVQAYTLQPDLLPDPPGMKPNIRSRASTGCAGQFGMINFLLRDGTSWFAALRAQDFDDAAEVLGGAAIGGYCVGSVFKEDDCVGVGRVLRKFLLRGGANPVGNAVGFGGKCG